MKVTFLLMLMISINSFSQIILNNSNDTKKSQEESKSKPLYVVKIKKTETQEGMTMSSKSNGVFFSQSFSLAQLVAQAYNVSPFAVVGERDLLDSKYAAEISLPRNDTELFEKVLQYALKDKLKISVKKEVREIEVYEMTAPNGVSKYLHVSEGKMTKASSDEGVIAGTNKKLDGIRIYAEEVLKTQVVDKTNLNGKYDYNLYWDAETPKSIIKALEDQLGLVLKKKKIKSEVITVK